MITPCPLDLCEKLKQQVLQSHDVSIEFDWRMKISWKTYVLSVTMDVQIIGTEKIHKNLQRRSS